MANVRYLGLALESRPPSDRQSERVALPGFAIAADRPILDAFRYGIAAAVAAVLTSATDRCHPADIDKRYGRVKIAPADLELWS